MKKKGNLFRLATQIFNTPLLITPDKLEIILNVLGDRIGLDNGNIIIEVDDNADDIIQKTADINKKIGVINIFGTLVQRGMGVDALSGLRSYDSIRKDLRAALNNKKVNSILLNIDSSGGEVSGCFDLVDEIFEARKIKPIFAFSNETAFSAAYAIASAANSLFLTRTAGVGSIGVIMVHTDKSEANKKAGVKFTPIFAGSKKIDLASFKPLSDRVKSEIQGQVDNVFNLFVGTVARNRNISEEEVRKFEAGFFMGEEAIKVGLADKVLNFDEVINVISNKEGDNNVLKVKTNINSNINLNKGDSKMDLEKLRNILSLDANATEEEILLKAQKLNQDVGTLTKDNEKLTKAIEAGSVKTIEDNKNLKVLSDKVTDLEESNKKNTELSEKLQTQLLENKRDLVINTAIEDGKILDKDKDIWEKQYMSDPETAINMIKTLRCVVPLEEKGNGDNSNSDDLKLKEKDRKIALKMDLNEKDYKNVPANWNV